MIKRKRMRNEWGNKKLRKINEKKNILRRREMKEKLRRRRLMKKGDEIGDEDEKRGDEIEKNEIDEELKKMRWRMK